MCSSSKKELGPRGRLQIRIDWKIPSSFKINPLPLDGIYIDPKSLNKEVVRPPPPW